MRRLCRVRSLFGVSQDALLWGDGVLVLAVVVVVLVAAIIRNPLLPRLAWRNVPRRPGLRGAHHPRA